MKKFFILFTIIFCQVIFAEDISFINSEETYYKDNVVLCKGKVIAIYHKKIIFADEISYDTDKDTVKAVGNVIMKDEFGNAFFADSLYVKDNFKIGSSSNLKIISVDKSRLAAETCEISNNEYILHNVIYTPCYECTQNGALTWQIKSQTVIFNPENHTEYRNVIMEAFNTPIMYIPYFVHASPNIKRKSGFLMPKLSYTSHQGLGVVIPYLFSISESQELIIKPIFTSRIGHVLWGYYGIRFPNGEFNIDASITGTKSVDKTNNDTKVQKIKNSGYRGHVFSKLRYEVDNNWVTGFDINLTSDRYYTKRFSFFDDLDRTLESTSYLEGFHGRNYTKLRTSMYQSEYTADIPKILPMLEHRHYIPLFKGTFGMDLVGMNLKFDNYRSSQKGVGKVSWYREILLTQGHILEVSTSFILQGLKVQEKTKSDYNSFMCSMPNVHLAWKWPLLVKTSFHDFILTPVLGTSISNNKKYYDAFENSLDEINVSNIFFNNKSISPYNIDYGKRYFYGVHINGYCRSRNIYHIALGESFDFTKPEKRLESTGMKEKKSNLVGAVDLFLTQNLTITSNLSYSRKHNRIDQFDIGLDHSNEKFSFNLMCFRGKQSFYNPFDVPVTKITENNSEKKYRGLMMNAGWKVSSRIHLNYDVAFGNRNDPIDLSTKKDSGHMKFIKQGFGIKYSNECVKFSAQYIRENKRGGDLKPETTFSFVIQLKNLG